jgi:hypothetical protein
MGAGLPRDEASAPCNKKGVPDHVVPVQFFLEKPHICATLARQPLCGALLVRLNELQAGIR